MVGNPLNVTPDLYKMFLAQSRKYRAKMETASPSDTVRARLVSGDADLIMGNKVDSMRYRYISLCACVRERERAQKGMSYD
jgi:hypothetical protein